MPRRPQPLPQSLPATVFSTWTAHDQGVSPYRLRDPRLRVMSRGIRQRNPVHVDVYDYLAALQEARGDSVFSHETAAAIWGMWLPPWVDARTPVHQSTVRTAGARARRRGVSGHVLARHARVTVHRGLRLTTPEWTWTDLAASGMALEGLVAAGDSLLQRRDGPAAEREPGRHPVSSVEDLRAAVALRVKVKGVVRMREALGWLRPGADSGQESRLRVRLVLAGYPEPVVNPEVRLSTGENVPPDLAWVHLKICIQYEGDHHRSDARQWDRDIGRDRRMQQEGWIVLRVTKRVFTYRGWAEFTADLDRALASRS